jgi:4-amino-4-deoxy-L-arabinose transferase-like glycosyltransferase
MMRLERVRAIPWLLVAILALAGTLRLWRLGGPALIGDEGYYWLWSEHLALSYLDNPAGMALLVWLSTLLGGTSEAGIRWLNAVLGIASAGLAYAINGRLFSRRAAALASALIVVGAPFLLISRFAYTDTLQLYLLLLNLYLLIPFLHGGEGRGSIPTWRFWAAGLSMAALLNVKYSAYLYALAMAALLAWRRPALLRDRRTWWAIGLSLSGLLPALSWNAQHDWLSYRWQAQHALAGGVGRSSPPGGLVHAVRYLTPPLVSLALIGALGAREPRGRILLVPGLVLVVPILLSPMNSPRNLSTGLALLLMLAGDVLVRWVRNGRRAWVTAAVLSAVLILAGVYGLGTILETLGPTGIPHSSGASTVRQDGAGWRDTAALGLEPEGVVFALDYSIAAQLQYYTGIPIYTSWAQYRLWGIPDLCSPGEQASQEIQVVALTYLDGRVVSERLASAFKEVRGPEEVWLHDAGGSKAVRIWGARGCDLDTASFLDTFDLLHLSQPEPPDG